MKILFIEPFFSGSHALWMEGIKEHSTHDVSFITMPGKNWKWRMLGGSIECARQFNELSELPDLIVASDMVDLASFLALTRKKSQGIPAVIYFHENQLTYPWSQKDSDFKRNTHRNFALINYRSALAADHLLFNSDFHRRSFLDALPGLLSQFDDFTTSGSAEGLSEKSSVLPLGLSLSRLDQFSGVKQHDGPPVILWNHRWAYDKNPELFFKVLEELDDEGLDFRAAVLGEHPDVIPREFIRGREALGDKICAFGYAGSFEQYGRWLHKSDILPVTSNQDFFGISIMEALYCGVFPLLPERLAYPELIPTDKFPDCYYRDGLDLSRKLAELVGRGGPESEPALRELAAQYDWPNMIELYDNTFEKTAGQN